MKRKGISFMLLCLLAMACLLLTCSPGCSQADVQSIKDVVSHANQQSDAYAKIIQDANAQLAEARMQVEILPQGPERDKALAQVVKLKSVVDSASAKMRTIQAAIANLDQRMKDAQDAPAVIEAFSSTAGTAVPQPYGLFLALAGTTIAGFLRAAQNRSAARDIASSLNPLLTDEQKQAIDKGGVQTATARRIVDEAQGTKAKLLL